ncbi:outer arm dynein light chain 1 protein [Tanacetum coccineum]
MFRFSCFHSSINSQKPKKTVHLPTETMQKTLEDYNISKPKKDPVFSKEVSQGVNANPSPSSMGQDWKSEGLKSMNDTDSEHAHEIRKMRKSISLGSGLARYQDITSGGESSSSRGNRSGDEYQQGRASVSPQISSNLVNNNASDLSPDDQPRSDKEVGGNSTRFCAACTGTSHAIVKSKSMPYLHSTHANVVKKSRSSEDLKVLDSRRSDKSVDNDAGETSPEQGIENESVAHVDKTDGDDGDGDGDGEDAYDYEGSAKDWIVPAVNELDKGKGIQEDYSDCQWEELPNSCISNLDPDVQNGKDATLDPMAASKNDAKALPGMDAAKRYISSLSAAATTAQLANHGLVVIPFLSALSSLRALNLSGNSIVRITAGALPRGLHILNLSKNSISTIEGLRELTRLRVLDLSYNRILRIGHGLASCSSLKELYLAGNKITKDWIVPAVNELDKGKGIQEDYSDCQWEELPNEDFKMKRIEKWVMDLQHSSSLEETDMLTNLDPDVQNGKDATLDPMAASKNDAKALPGMDAAKRYISSLSAAATTAQLANHGLVVIPFLSALSSLRALNLSGNSIVRITAGALPRGLHILNLSKNSISTIEGLRELTRLRVLDLSYNRILRIGHGLASCSSLKELYLAGNKISEVEGLHRLLKLNVLDLRFNKLSTTKNLGQLAANYNSLQAISLEGNPAQKNIGDEQLKKFLLGLLPHLAYFNRQSIKTGAMKDSADRAARLGISAHQIDRGVRAESKKATHGRKSQAVSGRGRHVRLPPSGVKVTGDRHQFPDVSSKLVSFRPDLAMRRIHSEGLLRAV